MSNTSASGGYLTPTASLPLPGGLTLTQFIQSVLVGISGYAGTLVRPKFQQEPPKQPDINTDWIAFAIRTSGRDANAFNWLDSDEVNHLSRQEQITVELSFYGPNALDNASIVLDGFQITQNLEALYKANMGYKGLSDIIRGPDLINERWVERYETSVLLVRHVQRTYPILSFASAVGVIHTVVDGDDLAIPFEANGG